MRHELHNECVSSDLLKYGPSGANWRSAPSEICLHSNEVHVWRASLACGSDALRLLGTNLTEDERDRARRFLFERDRNHFIAGRGILRELLGKYLSRPPAELKFRYGPQGKPTLSGQKSQQSVRFNLSHSHGLAVFAFSLDRELGVDLELVRSDVATEEIASRYFSARELAEFRLVPPHLRAEAFFLCWTRKEAFVKARGEGLHIPLDSFSVSLTPGEVEKLEGADCEGCTISSLQPAPGFVGAIVGEVSDCRLSQFDWQP